VSVGSTIEISDSSNRSGSISGKIFVLQILFLFVRFFTL
jgi:hypothetical protein